MEPENIDWNNVESEFIEDDTYENYDAPQWVDLSAPDRPVHDEPWFCAPDCKHQKNNADFLKPVRLSKVKLLRTASISEILPFRDRNRRNVKPKEKEINPSSSTNFPDSKSLKTKGSYYSQSSSIEDGENRNPNVSAPIPNGRTRSEKATRKPSTENEKKSVELSENSSKHDRKPQMRNTFSARNLLGGREILNQITEFCSELKKLGRRRSWKKGTKAKEQDGVLGELKKRVRDRERSPLLVVKEEQV
ncbi:uncharacterized protein LOC121268377 isoform X2 [Juglans microcarpa x Juglans regia]|uniref:uncharacterized protein LOC121268377 isoform X2 n=1 Tax=Juglans microcarpa x Juglans regia TaxID=2249226 RepID=UPI001B7F5656|nr:uncharacterized protein LOC121268377 isoform X2 [Juglans microcarpa x Juglans regia]